MTNGYTYPDHDIQRVGYAERARQIRLWEKRVIITSHEQHEFGKVYRTKGSGNIAMPKLRL